MAAFLAGKSTKKACSKNDAGFQIYILYALLSYNSNYHQLYIVSVTREPPFWLVSDGKSLAWSLRLGICWRCHFHSFISPRRFHRTSSPIAQAGSQNSSPKVIQIIHRYKYFLFALDPEEGFTKHLSACSRTSPLSLTSRKSHCHQLNPTEILFCTKSSFTWF